MSQPHWPEAPTAGEALGRIRTECRDESEKGRWFENLFLQLIRDLPEFEVREAWRWRDWPGTEKFTEKSYEDIGIDLVAMLYNGNLVAIQCKCYQDTDTIQRVNINSFLAALEPPFDMGWVVATCMWGANAEKIIEDRTVPVRRIDFNQYADVRISKGEVKRERREPLPLQVEAIESVVTRMAEADRGQLIMACGTGKTYTALCVAEQMVPQDGGLVLFCAPSIALVSQSRREWLQHSTRPLRGLVVCSDHGAGGRGESEDIRISEMECAVTTDPAQIAEEMKNKDGRTGVIFCTYQSLKQVSEAQQKHGAPDFDIIIADEAHRTTGIEKDTGFHIIHKNDSIRGKKRLYMSATPKVFRNRDKDTQRAKGRTVYDMEDYDRFGEVAYRLTFKKAVEAGILSDYRVIVMCTHDADEVRDLYDRYMHMSADDGDGEHVIKYEDVERLVGVAFAINGVGVMADGVDRRPRVLGFSNSIWRSKTFEKLLNLSDLHNILNKRLGVESANGGKMHRVEHLDGTSSAILRNQALRKLRDADSTSPYMITNVKLFTEGVDVPSLNAVAFMDPRDSTVDIIQAVGRVMRASDSNDKQLGYIIVPVPVEGELTEENLMATLDSNQEGWKSFGRVLRALQAHDSRMPEDPMSFIDIGTMQQPPGAGAEPWKIGGFQDKLEFEEFSERFYTRVVGRTGLAPPGQMASDEIESAVRGAADIFKKLELAGRFADTLGLVGEFDDRDICKIAALLVINACLLHRRLQDVMEGLTSLDDVNGSVNPRHALLDAWRTIVDRDYRPVFEPALNIVEVLPDSAAKNAIYRLVDRANSVADTLSELGYDHAGPLYHKILGTAKSDSANYTDNKSALMLARLAFSDNFTDWSDMKKVSQLRVMDPACGTGTLLMASLKVIKERIALDESHDSLHKKLVEDVLCGMDINRYAVQLAACNLTLGAPTVDYKNMNLYTTKHGPQPDGGVKAGSVELLRMESDRDMMKALVRPMKGIKAEHVDNAEQMKFPLSGLDVVIMNPPFGSNTARSRKYPDDVVKQMQRNELDIKSRLQRMDKEAGEVIDANSIRLFFTPLADRLLDSKNGTLAQVMPVTACIGASGLEERKFLADRFWVECIIASHDPQRLNFSYKTGIHECLMVCRRYDGDIKPPTEFVSLYRMPKSAEEAIEAADAISGGNTSGWGSAVSWPAERIATGDWSPVQWYNQNIAEKIMELESSGKLESIGSVFEIGPAGQQLRGNAYKECAPNTEGAVKTFWSVSSELRKTIKGEPESWRMPSNNSARELLERSSKLLVAAKHRTTNGCLTAVYSETPSIGSGWIPIQVKDEYKAKAIAVWWNSTPVRMMLLNRRTKMLTYPQWSLEHLRQIKIPKPDNLGWDTLYETYGKICDRELLPLKQATEDPVRAVIDGAAAKVLNTNPDILTEWREMLSREPTISNVRASQ